jgi:chorismate mutase
VGLLARRMDVVGQMRQPKRQHQEATLQMARWQQVLEHCCEVARQRGLSESFVVQLYQLIHEEAIRVQEEPPVGEAAT